MYITQLELIKAKLDAAGKLNTSEIIKDIIGTHEKTDAYKEMLVGEKYFDGEHDILQKNFQMSYVYESQDDEGYDAASSAQDKTSVINNLNSSNHHNVHNYFAELVEQEQDFITGRPPAVIVEGASKNDSESAILKEFEDELTAYTSDELFADLISDTIEEARTKGRAFWHVYIDLKGNMQVIIMPSQEIIPIFDTGYEREIREVIRYYKIKIVRNKTEKEITRVEWWYPDRVEYYLESDAGEFLLETKGPHWTEAAILEDGKEGVKGMSFGEVPFIEVVPNRKRRGLLPRIKGLVDAYNLLSSKLTNDEIDLVALYWVVKGYGGESAAKIRKKLELNKGVNLDDPEGDVSAHQVNLNTSDRIEYLESLKKDIFNLGYGFVPDVERSGNVNTTELKMRYAKLRMKASGMTRHIKVSLKKLFEFVVEDINATNGKNYDYKLAKIEFHFNEVINETEQIENALKLRGFVPDTILMTQIPFVDDPNQANTDMEKQKAKENLEKSKLYGTGLTRPGTLNIDNKIVGASEEV